jgi:hypothetical protein
MIGFLRNLDNRSIPKTMPMPNLPLLGCKANLKSLPKPTVVQISKNSLRREKKTELHLASR